jgi:hypothetical protein
MDKTKWYPVNYEHIGLNISSKKFFKTLHHILTTSGCKLVPPKILTFDPPTTPIIEIKEPKTYFNAGTPVTLSCGLIDHENIKFITWFKCSLFELYHYECNSQQFCTKVAASDYWLLMITPLNKALLIIQNSLPSDEGTYLCLLKTRDNKLYSTTTCLELNDRQVTTHLITG